MGRVRRGTEKTIRMSARALESPCPQTPPRFTSDDQLLEEAAQLFRVRQAWIEGERRGDLDQSRRQQLLREEADWTRHWHTSFQLTDRSVTLCQRCKQHRLNRTEREVLAALMLAELAVLCGKIKICCELLELVARPGKKPIRSVRMLSEHGRLFTAKLISFDDPDEDFADRRLLVDPMLVDAILVKRGRAESGWLVSEEMEVYDCLQPLTRVLVRKSEIMQHMSHGYNQCKDAFKWSRKADRLRSKLDETLERHPGWRLTAVYREIDHPQERIIFLALLGKHLGHVQADDSVFSGGGLARAASDSPDEVAHTIRLLTPRGKLVGNDLIRPCCGETELASSDPAELEQTEFDLTEKAVELLGLGKRVVKDRSSEFHARKPTMHLDQLVLADSVRQALDMAIAHTQYGRRLLDDWGLGAMIPYGRNPVLLFSGPPGTGKTATADALADSLGRSILVADYSRIQNCFVGQTEKNIVRAFREAKIQDAVLFWDEADAMFYDRDSAHRNWEVRDVNVLLQQLERFEGICILATNRKITLDKALERRITLKVDFPRPNLQERRRIWEKIMPRTMPTSRDLDLDELSTAELVGGEIKNVVLNAARIAVRRDDRGPVTMRDFREALAMEQQGRWTDGRRGPIGFGG